MTKYIFLQNILTPYRIALFDALHRYGFDSEVYYMRETESDRNWTIDQSTLGHPFYMDHGFYKTVGRFHLHFNPRLIVKLLRVDAELLLGGSWNDLNVLFLVLLKRLGLVRKQYHFWSEANYMTIGASRDNAFKRALRKFVFLSSDGALITPGKMSEITFGKWEITGKTFIRLPNTIEEEHFQCSDADVAARTVDGLPVFLMPVRLAEKVKGILNFFRAIGDDQIRRARFLIAGDGPDRKEIQAYITSRHLDDHIALMGHRDTTTIVELFKKANALVLPSFSDPSPLTLVEALVMRLPVLVSQRCGNHFEAVIEGDNGYLFDPLDPESVRRAFMIFMERVADWPAMGEISAQIYRERFDRNVAIEHFTRELQAFSDRQSGASHN